MKILERLNSICQKYNVQIAFLFGSMAEDGHRFLLEKGAVQTPDPYSDLDLGLVFFDEELFNNVRRKLRLYGHLFDDLSVLFSPFKLDLVFLEETDYLVQYEAIKGINVFKKNNIILADYVERVLKYAPDWKYEVDRFYQEVRRAVGDGHIVVEYEPVAR